MNSADISYALIAETVPGTTPATGVWIPVAHLDSSGGVSVQTPMVDSETKTATRDGLGARALSEQIGGDINMELRVSDAHRFLLSSGLSGTWASKVLKAGIADKSFTIRKKTANGASDNLQYFRGSQVSTVTLNGEAGAFLNIGYTIISQSGEETATAIAALTEGTESSNSLLTSSELGAVSIGSFTDLELASFNLEISHTRNAIPKMGSRQAKSISTSGRRVISGSIKVFKEDHTLATTLGEAGQKVELTIGTVNNGYKITIPKANFSRPQDEDGETVFQVIDFSGALDPTTGTGITITEL